MQIIKEQREQKSYAKSLSMSFIKSKYALLYKGILIGLFGGVIVTLYRILLIKISNILYPLYENITQKPIMLIPMFLLLALCGYIVGIFIKIEPMITGSGIPQVQGVLIGKMKFRWLRVIILKFIGGIISLGAGLSLGREGPSVQIGAASGLGISRMTGGNKTSEKYCLTFGSSAGLSAAFNAPIAGTLFAFEELQKGFSSQVLFGAMSAALVANIISSSVFGMNPVFDFEISKQVPLQQYPYLVLLAIVLGLLGALFNKSILTAINKYEKYFRLSVEFKPILPFMFAGFIGITMPMLLGGGSEIIEELIENEYTLLFVLSLLVLKFIFTIISYCSSAPGGIFLPLLSIGGIIGCIIAKVFIDCFGMNSDYIKIFIMLGMAGYFSAVVKSPITAIILIAEMTGSAGNLFALGFVCIISYIVSLILKTEPIYEMLLNNTLKNKGRLEETKNKIYINIPIKINSKVVRKKIGDLSFPKDMVITNINKHGKDLIPNKDMRFDVGDQLTILTEESIVYEILVYFN